MFLSKEKIQFKIQEYIDDKKAQNLPWDTLEYDYLLKDLHADIWNEKGDMLPENDEPLPSLDIGGELISHELVKEINALYAPSTYIVHGGWNPMSTFPQDGKVRLIKTTTGIVDAWYCPEEDNTGYFELPGEGYVPPCLVCYDDEFQIFAENNGDGDYFPGVLGWMEIPE